MRRLFLVTIVVALLASTWAAHAAPPPEGPPGLAKAIAAQMRHNPHLLTTPGVVGTAVGLGEDGTAVVRVFTQKPGVGHLPAFLDGVPVAVQVTGKLTALKVRNSAPRVSISSPADGGHYGAGELVTFAATAQDKQDGDLSSGLVWVSSRDGDLWYGERLLPRAQPRYSHHLRVGDRLGPPEGQASVTITVEEAPAQPKTTDIWPRPVPIGVSTGNDEDVSAGTIACRVVDAAGNVYALSNTHVFAPNDVDGQSEIGDLVTQPGLYDVPSHVYDHELRLGAVSAYKPINGSIFAFNDIDAAIALTDRDSLEQHHTRGARRVRSAEQRHQSRGIEHGGAEVRPDHTADEGHDHGDQRHHGRRLCGRLVRVVHRPDHRGDSRRVRTSG